MPIYRYATWLPIDLALSVGFDGIDTGLHCRAGKETLFIVGGSTTLHEEGCEALYLAAKAIVWAFEHDRKYASRDMLAEWQRRAKAGAR